ncbi:MAG: SDR family NAD(P)-dependent oxidoreductase [Chroococcales cyanobacterium]
MTNIAGKTVLLTGASGGIGQFIAHSLARKKATILAVSRTPEKLAQVCTEINELGGKGIPISFDISQVENLPTLIEKIARFTDSVDILINNAGKEIYQAFHSYSLNDLQSVLSINLLAAMELTRLLLPSLLAQGSGHIVNIASLAGKKGHPYDSIYSASKGGLLMWSDALRQELAGTGVKISSVCPGYVSSHGMLADTGIPAPRLAGISSPEAVAAAVIRAIEKNQTEVIINSNPLTETLTKLFLAIEQFFPQWGDTVNSAIGVTRLNQMRIQTQSQKEAS